MQNLDSDSEGNVGKYPYMHDGPLAVIIETMSNRQKAIPGIVDVSQSRDGIVYLIAWLGADIRGRTQCIRPQTQRDELLEPLI